MVRIEEDGTTPRDLRWLGAQFGLTLTVDTDRIDAHVRVTPLTNNRPVILLANNKNCSYLSN